MIAKVRIAPFEYWCEPWKEDLAKAGIAPEQVCGREVAIYTGKIYEDPRCHGKLWEVVIESANEIRVSLGKVPDQDRSFFCEHQLEMD